MDTVIELAIGVVLFTLLYRTLIDRWPWQT
jgi:hypothetical protein